MEENEHESRLVSNDRERPQHQGFFFLSVPPTRSEIFICALLASCLQGFTEKKIKEKEWIRAEFGFPTSQSQAVISLDLKTNF